MKKTLTILLLQLFVILQTTAQSAGTWKAYLAYSDITEVEQAGNLVYVLASSNLYSYNTNDHSTQTYSKMDVLNDVKISHISFNKASHRLVIVYADDNIDLMETNGSVINLSDVMNFSTTLDKTVTHLYNYNENIYMSTGFGIIKLNTKKVEISDTYNLGFPIDYSYIENGYIYAASEKQGLYRALLTDNLKDKNAWNHVGNYIKQDIKPSEEILEKISGAQPGGPKYNLFGFIRFTNNHLYTCAGGYLASIDHFYPGIIQVKDENDEWQIYEENVSEKTGHSYIDIMEIDADPRDEKRVFAGSRVGLYEFYDGKFVKEWSYDNSIIQSLGGGSNKNYTMLMTVKFDNSGNLWMVNSIAPQRSLIEYTANGEWVDHHNNVYLYGSNTLNHNRHLLTGSDNWLWWGTDTWDIPTVSCYNTQTKTARMYRTFVNQDGSTISPKAIQTIAEDKEGNIWIGTQVGPIMIEKDERGVENPVFTQVKVPRNDGTNYADYLLDGVNVTAIVVDGGNRKWIGTRGQGIYLISSDNIEEISHFTSENSELLSNEIISLALNDKTGELFISTNDGLCSYMTDGTEPSTEMTKDNVYAYPNPVRPDYTGPITIVGLTYNADVKITTVNGTLVCEGRSNGGSFTWDGCDQQGRRVASGIYMVQTATEEGGKGTVCKIAVVN